MKNILLIYTGGTIGMQKDLATDSLKAVDFNKLISSIPEIRDVETNIHYISLIKIILNNL